MSNISQKIMCESKVQHKTLSSVLYIIDQFGNTQDYYTCEHCGFYHVFTIDKRNHDKKMNKNHDSFVKKTNPKMNRKKKKYKDGFSDENATNFKRKKRK